MAKLRASLVERVERGPMEALLLSLPKEALEQYVLKPTLMLLKSKGFLKLVDNTDPFIALTQTLPSLLLAEPNATQLLAAAFQKQKTQLGGGNRPRRSLFAIFIMYIVLLLALLSGAAAASAAKTSAASATSRTSKIAYATRTFTQDATAIASRHEAAKTIKPALAKQRLFDIATLSKYSHTVQDFVDLRYQAIKDKPVNDYHRIQAHNAYETVEWFASNQSMGFLWLLVTCDRVDLDIKLNAAGEIVMYHAPHSPKALAWALSKLDPNHVKLVDALEYVALVAAHYPQHVLMINIENHGVPGDMILEAFQAAGLQHKMASLAKAKAAPTVQQLVESGKNLLVFTDEGKANGLHLTRDYYNENDYKCKGDISTGCNTMNSINKPRTDLGTRKHIDPALEFKEINAFANSRILGLPQSAREQEAFDMSARYSLASSGQFNPWQIGKNSERSVRSVRSVGINRDFVRLDTDVWQNLVMNVGHKNKKLENLRTTLGEIHRLYTPAQAQYTYAVEMVNKLLQNSAITRFIVLQSIQRFQSMSTHGKDDARGFFKHEYKTVYNDYLPLMPKALFCEVCIVVMGAGLLGRKKKRISKTLKQESITGVT